MDLITTAWEVWGILSSVGGEKILGGLLLLSEGLALMPWFKSNGIIDAVINGLKKVGAKKATVTE